MKKLISIAVFAAGAALAAQMLTAQTPSYLPASGVTAVNCAAGSCTESQINTALNRAAVSGQGGTLVVPDGLVTASNPIVVPAGKPYKIQCGKNTKIAKNFSGSLFKAWGTQGASSNLTSNAAKGALSIAVASGASFSAGQWIQVSDLSDTVGQCSGANSGNSCNLELQQIESVSGNTLNLKSSLDGSYATASTAAARVITPAQVVIDGCSVDTTGKDTAVFDLLYAVDSKILNVNIGGGALTSQQGIYVRRSKNVEVAGVTVANSDGLLITGGNVSPLQIGEGSAYVDVHDSHFRKFVENGASTYSHHLNIHDNSFEGFSDDGFNTHGYNVHDVRIAGNIFSGEAANSSTQTVCVIISNGNSTNFADHDILVSGNHCSGWYKAAFELDGMSTKKPSNIKFTGNYVNSTLGPVGGDPANTEGAFLILDASGVSLIDNHVMSVPQNQNGFYILGVDDWQAIANEVQCANLGGEFAYQVDAGSGAAAVTNGVFAFNKYGGCASRGVYLGSPASGNLDHLKAVGTTVTGTAATTPWFASANITNYTHFMNDGDSGDVLPNPIDAPGVQVGAGVAMTSNQGNGAAVQHSTGALVSGNVVKADANSNTADAGVAAANLATKSGGLVIQACTTGSIGGGALAAGASATGTCTVGSSATGHSASAVASDGSVQGNYAVQATVSGTTATVTVTAVTAGTPTAKTYAVTVF